MLYEKIVWGHYNVNPISGVVENIRQVAGGVRHHPDLNTRNHCEKTNFFFAYQIGHIEIGRNRADLR